MCPLVHCEAEGASRTASDEIARLHVDRGPRSHPFRRRRAAPKVAAVRAPWTASRLRAPRPLVVTRRCHDGRSCSTGPQALHPVPSSRRAWGSPCVAPLPCGVRAVQLEHVDHDACPARGHALGWSSSVSMRRAGAAMTSRSRAAKSTLVTAQIPSRRRTMPARPRRQTIARGRCARPAAGSVVPGATRPSSLRRNPW